MKIKFENVGRFKKTWVAEYPITAPLENVCEDIKWWCNQLKGVLLSSPEWSFDPENNCVDIFAGWNCVGKARIVDEQEGGQP